MLASCYKPMQYLGTQLKKYAGLLAVLPSICMEVYSAVEAPDAHEVFKAVKGIVSDIKEGLSLFFSDLASGTYTCPVFDGPGLIRGGVRDKKRSRKGGIGAV